MATTSESAKRAWETRRGAAPAKDEEKPSKAKKAKKADITKWARRKTSEVVGEAMERAAQGGFSVRPFAEHPFPSKGIMVSLPTSAGMSAKIDMGKGISKKRLRKNVEKFFNKVMPFLLDNPDMHVGGWVSTDEKTGKKSFYLDVSQRVHANGNGMGMETLNRARKMGRDANQIAIFRLDDFKEFKTGGTGE